MLPNALPIGAWTDDRARLATASRSVRGDIADLPEEVRFQVHVARSIRRREANANAEKDGFAAFVLVDTEEQKRLLAEDAKRRLDRSIYSGAKRLTGALHFVTSLATASVVEDVVGDDSMMCDRLTDLGLDLHPALLYFPQEPVSGLFYFPEGTARADTMREVLLNAGTVTEAEVLQVLNAIHEQELVTPDNMGPTKIWADAAKGWPVQEAERTIQQLARCALIGQFFWCSIQQEQPGKIGRTDLEIVDDRNGPPGEVRHHALLELKVLRAYGSTGIKVADADMEKHIQEGVEQANTYGAAKNFIVRMLCCFDMRDADLGDARTFAHVQGPAGAFNVSLKRWYLYRSSQDWRAAIAKAKLGSLPSAVSASPNAADAA